jgi:oligopeptide/dipeptide ABC transporter ATP-binding protein
VAELSPKRELFDNPLHPYTQALLSAIPKPNPRRKTQRVILEGDVPSPINPPSGCRFHTRCPACYSPCSKVEPKTIEVEEGHFVRCHLYDPDHAPKEAAIWKRLPVPPAKYREDRKEDGTVKKAAAATAAADTTTKKEDAKEEE